VVWILLFQNVWVRRAALVLCVVLVLLGLREHLVRVGERKGMQAEQSRSVVEGEQARSQERQNAVSRIGLLQEQIGKLERQSEALAAVVARNNANAQLGSAQRIEAAASVAAIPSASLHLANVKALAAAGVSDSGGGVYSPDEERAIAACLADRPLCQKQNVALSAANEGLQQQVLGEQKALGFEQQRYDVLAGYTGDLEREYVRMYNAIPKNRNWVLSVVTLGLKGRPKRLAVPSLEELRRGNGKTKAGD
jgi:hypothetical protein